MGRQVWSRPSTCSVVLHAWSPPTVCCAATLIWCCACYRTLVVVVVVVGRRAVCTSLWLTVSGPLHCRGVKTPDEYWGVSRTEFHARVGHDMHVTSSYMHVRVVGRLNTRRRLVMCWLWQAASCGSLSSKPSSQPPTESPNDNSTACGCCCCVCVLWCCYV